MSLLQFRNNDVEKILQKHGELLVSQIRLDQEYLSNYIYYCAKLNCVQKNKEVIEILMERYMRILDLEQKNDQEKLIKTAKQLCIGGFYDNVMVKSLSKLRKDIELKDRGLIRIFEVRQMA